MFTVRPMQTTDIAEVVSIHLVSFQGFFLSFLGRSFLWQLYTGVLADDYGIAFVAERSGHVQGFIAGTDNPQGFYKRLIQRRWWRFGLAAIGPAIRKPKRIPRLLRAFSRGQQGDVHENCSTLMSIAVSPEVQGKGLGTLLVQAFLDESFKRGVRKVNLTTDKNENESVNLFYQNIGFRLFTSYRTPEGREMNEYSIEINSR